MSERRNSWDFHGTVYTVKWINSRRLAATYLGYRSVQVDATNIHVFVVHDGLIEDRDYDGPTQAVIEDLIDQKAQLAMINSLSCPTGTITKPADQS